MSEEEPIEIPINGELDLHTFRPNELGDLIPDYIEQCLELGLHRVRIIHGKGTGTLRETVHKLLKRNPHVVEYRIGNESEGSWGATIAYIKDA
jgi:dsDNA-specific endonuclease/ATPase MutS2